MKLCDMTLTSYLALLGSGAPAPGGGSASALLGAQGAALAAMVAALTIGKKKYPLDQALCQEVYEKATSLREALLSQVDRDTEAFNLVSDAFRLPKESDEEKAARKKAIADATLVATKPPFETMMLCRDTLALTASLLGHSNQNAASDLGVSALNLIGGMKGAWLNVLINLGGLADEALAAELKEKGEKAVKEAEMAADAIYDAVLSSL